MKEDPDELNDIAEKKPELCQKCRKELFEYYQSQGFDEALDGDKLVEYEYEQIEPSGYINQDPQWPETVVED